MKNTKCYEEDQEDLIKSSNLREYEKLKINSVK